MTSLTIVKLESNHGTKFIKLSSVSRGEGVVISLPETRHWKHNGRENRLQKLLQNSKRINQISQIKGK